MATTIHANLDATGEGLAAAKLLASLSDHVDLTVLNLERTSASPLSKQLKRARVITIKEPLWLSRYFGRFNSMAMPYVPFFLRECRKLLYLSLVQGGGQIDVFGIHAGSKLATELTYLHPTRVRKLILTSA
ncbi:MAG: hypothetical protein ABJ327_12730, partial [Litoreibacter sp.]